MPHDTNDRARVAAGATLLDKYEPGWAMKIDTARLRIESGCDCILGQLYGQFGVGLARLEIGGAPGIYGFTGTFGYYDVLNETWREEIARRRLATVAPQEVEEVGQEAYC